MRCGVTPKAEPDPLSLVLVGSTTTGDRSNDEIPRQARDDTEGERDDAREHFQDHGRTHAPAASSRTRAWPVWATPLLFACLALSLTLPRLTFPGEYVFDELYYAHTAGHVAANDPGLYDTSVLPRDEPAIEWTHPPLAKLVITGGILVFGDQPFGWRIASALLGALGVALAYLLGRDLSGSAVVGAVAAGLLLFDGLWFVESRLGMSNILYAVLANAALFAFARALAAPAPALGPLLATGLFLGLALATKWSAAALIGFVGLAIGWRVAILWRTGQRENANALARTAALALIALPAAVYAASWLHFFLVGNGLADLVALHRAMLAYHAGIGVPHPDSSPWWTWPLAAKPVWYYTAPRGTEGAFVIANGNPLLYWPMVPAVAWVAIDWWGRRPRALLVLAVGFAGQWLPWALSPRGTFLYHFLPVVPLGCIALAVVLVGLWSRARLGRFVAGAYAVAVVAAFAFFYPVLAALPVTPEQLDLRLWFDSWR